MRFPGAPHPPPAAYRLPLSRSCSASRRALPPSNAARDTSLSSSAPHSRPRPRGASPPDPSPKPVRCAPSSRAEGASCPSSCAALTDARGGQWERAEGPGVSSYWPREEEEPGLEVGVRDPAVRSARLGAAARGSILRRQQPRPGQMVGRGGGRRSP